MATGGSPQMVMRTVARGISWTRVRSSHETGWRPG